MKPMHLSGPLAAAARADIAARRREQAPQPLVVAGSFQDMYDQMLASTADAQQQAAAATAPYTQQAAQQAAPFTQPVVQELAKQASPVVEESARKGVLDGIGDALRNMPTPAFIAVAAGAGLTVALGVGTLVSKFVR